MKLSATFRHLRQQPVLSAVTIIGTALSIFLIMIVVMMQQIKVTPIAPEVNRDRVLHAKFGSITNKDWGEENSSNGAWSEKSVKDIFYRMKTPEAVTAYTVTSVPAVVSLPGQPALNADLRYTDAAYWKVLDFTFIDGKPFTQSDFDSAIRVAVICKSLSKQLFGSTEATGRDFLINHVPYRVTGVVNDVSTIAETAYAQAWIPFSSSDLIRSASWGGDYMGPLSVTMLARSRDDFQAIRQEYDRLFHEEELKAADIGWQFISRNRPYDQEKAMAGSADSSNEPDMAKVHRQRLIIYAILLLVPAINISSMTHSRLRQRASEIGVRRAFGAKRLTIMRDILAENTVITLIAGLLGLILSIIVAVTAQTILFRQEFSNTLADPQIDISMLIHWSTFGLTLLFCFLLNLLSSGIPAWKASRESIDSALSGKH